uniref:Uncharacterized protein n=1 Tax=Clandestinovirus TaxID=2831644 RepID=A0A8F8KRV7_9VIRU|nr:hypothetical protein KOM_12_574 [Clandestinovirus]
MQALWRTCQDVTVETLTEHLASTLNIQVEEDFEGHTIVPPSEPLEVVDIVNETSDDPVMETDIDRSLWRGFNWEHVWLYGKGWFVFVWDTNKENAAIKAVETLLERYEYLDQKDEESTADDFHLVHYKNGKKRVYMSEDEKRLDAVSSLLKNPCWVYSKPLNVAGGQDFGYESIIIQHQHELSNSTKNEIINPNGNKSEQSSDETNSDESDSD